MTGDHVWKIVQSNLSNTLFYTCACSTQRTNVRESGGVKLDCALTITITLQFTVTFTKYRD